MNFDLFFLIVILSLVVYRVARFIVLDTLVEVTRSKAYMWLLSRERPIFHKIHELLSCPYCITIWVSAATVLTYDIAVDPMPMPVFVWLAVAAGSLIPWRIIDWDDD